MTATVAASFDATLSPSQALQASDLWTFVQLKTPRFTTKVALEIVRDLNVERDEDPKHLAKRLRRQLHERGTAIKHTAALELAARLLGHTSWHRAEPQYTLRLTAFSADRDEIFPSWHVMAPRLRRWCGIVRKAAEAKVLQVRVSAQELLVTTPSIHTDEQGGETPFRLPVVVVKPELPAPNWLDGAAIAFESVRRHLEEPGNAVLDGVLVLQLCGAAENATSNDSVRARLSLADAENAELVLMLLDHSGRGYEVARGDELACWTELELLRGADIGAQLVQDGAAWCADDDRFVWSLSVVRPDSMTAPEVLITPLSQKESERLLRRYRLARRVFGGQVQHRQATKQLQYLSSVESTYRVNLGWLQEQFDDADYTWESFCEEAGLPARQLSEHLPLEIVLTLAERLGLDAPNRIFGLPERAELTRVADDTLLRTLLPRVDAVRVRLSSGLSEQAQAALREALVGFNTVLKVQKLSESGRVTDEASGQTPHVAFTNECEKFRQQLHGLGMKLFAGVVPHLESTQEWAQACGVTLPDGEPMHAFGHALFLDIDVAAQDVTTS